MRSPRPESRPKPDSATMRARPGAPFLTGMISLGAVYVLLIVAFIASLMGYTTWRHFADSIRSPEILYAIKLSFVSCGITTILSLWIAVPIGYLMSRYEFRGKLLINMILDIPIVLPPLVIGLGLLILFTTPIGRAIDNALQASFGVTFTYGVLGVILAQFMVACAFAVQTMRVTFSEISPRTEEVAMTLGCSRSQAFWLVAIPEAKSGMAVAGSLAWARSFGEFGPVLIFAGATRGRTEVLPTTVFLEMSVGAIEAAVAVSLLMVTAALIVLFAARVFSHKKYPFV